MKTTVCKWGNSCGIRLSKIVLEELGLEEGDQVEMALKERTLVLRKADRIVHRTIEERFEGFDSEESMCAEEWNTGAPVGKEVL